MTGFLWAVLALVSSLGMTALGDMVSEEVRDRLDHLPHAILRLAARRLGPDQRAVVYEDEWMPELTYILKGDEARPITRLYHGTRFALGIFASARRIERDLPNPQESIIQASTWVPLWEPDAVFRDKDGSCIYLQVKYFEQGRLYNGHYGA